MVDAPHPDLPVVLEHFRFCAGTLVVRTLSERRPTPKCVVAFHATPRKRKPAAPVEKGCGQELALEAER